MYIDIFIGVFIFCNFIHYTDAILDNYIYEHPTQSDQKCYMCPPGYRINGIGDDPKKCSINRCEIATFPDCKACPDGYYTDEWSVSPRCREQTQCNGVGEKLLEYGGTTRRNVCGCRNGYTRSEKACIKYSCPKAPSTTACLEKLPSHAPRTEPIVKPVSSHPIVAATTTTENSISSPAENCNYLLQIIAIIVETVIIFAGGLYICFLKTKHKGCCCCPPDGNNGQKTMDNNSPTSRPSQNGAAHHSDEQTPLTPKPPAEAALLIIEEQLSDVDTFFLHGLLMDYMTVIRSQRLNTDPKDRIRKLVIALEEERGKKITAKELIAALRLVKMNAIAAEIETKIAGSDSADGGEIHQAEHQV